MFWVVIANIMFYCSFTSVQESNRPATSELSTDSTASP